MTTNNNWKVVITEMNTGATKENPFQNFKDAYSNYAEHATAKNLNNAEWTDAEMELSAGGRGYDYRVELLEDNI